MSNATDSTEKDLEYNIAQLDRPERSVFVVNEMFRLRTRKSSAFELLPTPLTWPP